ncbi:MAG TPA: TolC family protein [Spirochaetia bacterium]|nr:TolC family protein [Spirochaetia bacterium]
MRTSSAAAVGFLSLLLTCPAAWPDALTLDQAYDLARGASEAIHVKALAVRKAGSAVQEAQARALPHLDLQASTSYLTNPPTGITVTAGEFGTFSPEIPPHTLSPLQSSPISLGTVSLPSSDVQVGAQLHNYFSLAASLSQPLFTWGKIKNAIDLAGIQAQAAATDLTAQQRDIARQVHRSYFSAQLALQSIPVLVHLRDLAAGAAKDRQTSFDQGTVNRQSLLEAQANLAQVESKLVQAQQSAATALEGLSVLTGADPSATTLSTDFRTGMPAIDEQALLGKAIASSTDLARARSTAGQAGKALDIARGGSLLLPDVSLGVNFNVAGQEDLPYSAWDWNNNTWSWDVVISLGVKLSVFDGLAAARKVEEAQRDVEMAAQGTSQQEKLVRLSVRQAVDAALRADADASDKRAAADLGAERLKNAQASFDNGMASLDDLRGADILYGSARLDLLLALYTREEALADLERITGERL